VPPQVTGSPRQRVEREVDEAGVDVVVRQCVALLLGRADEVSDEFLHVVGGRSAPYVLRGREGGRDGYWPRAWGARALLYAWNERAIPAVVRATADEAWRVRENALKVIARHRVDEALEALTDCLDDDIPRVRAAAQRARVRLTEAR
jgi:hypothetical protein